MGYRQRQKDIQAIKGVGGRKLRLKVDSTYQASALQGGALRLVHPPFVPRSQDERAKRAIPNPR